ncbi:MAG TPA: hypothetical protein VF009_00845 [Solirubrobacterales bacterium]
MPSARRAPQLAVLALCGALGAGSLAGCETTQEKAAAQRAESARILKARAKHRNDRKHHADGTKVPPYGGKSSRRQEGEG